MKTLSFSSPRALTSTALFFAIVAAVAFAAPAADAPLNRAIPVRRSDVSFQHELQRAIDKGVAWLEKIRTPPASGPPPIIPPSPRSHSPRIVATPRVRPLPPILSG